MINNIFRAGIKARGQGGPIVTYNGGNLQVRELDIRYLESQGWTQDNPEAQTYFSDIVAARANDLAAISRLREIELAQLDQLLIENISSHKDDIQAQSEVLTRHLNARFPNDVNSQAAEAKRIFDMLPDTLDQEELLTTTFISLYPNSYPKQVKFAAKFIGAGSFQEELDTYGKILLSHLSRQASKRDNIEIVILTAFAIKESSSHPLAIGYLIGQMALSLSEEDAYLRAMLVLAIIKYLPMKPIYKGITFAVAEKIARISHFPDLEFKLGDMFYTDDSAKRPFIAAVIQTRSKIDGMDLDKILATCPEPAQPTDEDEHAEILDFLCVQPPSSQDEWYAITSAYAKNLDFPDGQVEFIERLISAGRDQLPDDEAKARFGILLCSKCYPDNPYLFGILVGELGKKIHPDDSYSQVKYLFSGIDLFPIDGRNHFVLALGDVLGLDDASRLQAFVHVGVQEIESDPAKQQQLTQQISAFLKTKAAADPELRIIHLTGLISTNRPFQLRVINELAPYLHESDEAAQKRFISRAVDILHLEAYQIDRERTARPAKPSRTIAINDSMSSQEIAEIVQNPSVSLITKLQANLIALKKGEDFTSSIFFEAQDVTEAIAMLAAMRIGGKRMTEILTLLQRSLKKITSKRSKSIYEKLHLAARWGVSPD